VDIALFGGVDPHSSVMQSPARTIRGAYSKSKARSWRGFGALGTKFTSESDSKRGPRTPDFIKNSYPRGVVTLRTGILLFDSRIGV
jgi:hypothetical protein